MVIADQFYLHGFLLLILILPFSDFEYLLIKLPLIEDWLDYFFDVIVVLVHRPVECFTPLMFCSVLGLRCRAATGPVLAV